MNKDIGKTFEDEFLSFFALYLMNLVFAALSMAIGMMIVILQVLPQSGTSPAGVPAIPFLLSLILGCAAFVFGLIWITVTAKLLKSVKVVRSAYKQKKKREMISDDFTSMMVHMMTQYRDQKKMIRAMVIICMLGGLCYVGLGALNIVQIISRIASGDAMQPVLITIFAAAINLTIGGASLLISTYFRRYAKVWDARLDALTISEGELDRMLERG